MKMLSNLDLNKNEIQNVRVQNLATAPSNPVVGQIYFNTTDKTGYIYDGTSWRDIAAIQQGGTYTAGKGIIISDSGEVSVTNPVPDSLRLYNYDIGTKTKTQIENDDIFKELCYQIADSPWDTILYLYTAANGETDSSVKNIIGAYHKTSYTTGSDGTITAIFTQMNNSTNFGITLDKVEIEGCNLSTIQIAIPLDAAPLLTSEVTINVGSDINYSVPTYDKLSHYVPISVIGSAGGVASLDSTGKVPSSQLPSYVDDVVEGYYYNGQFYTDSAHTQLITPETGKIYVDLDTNKTYRWGGTAYVEISQSTIHKFVKTITVQNNGNVPVSHNLGTEDVIVSVYDMSGNQVIVGVHIMNSSNITLEFANVKNGTEDFKVVIIA